MNEEILKFLDTIGAYKRMIVALCLVSVATTVGFTYVIPERFEASALILVRPLNKIQVNASGKDEKELLNYPVTGNVEIESPSKTFMEVIKSPTVVNEVVRLLELDKEEEKEPETLPLKIALIAAKDWAKEFVNDTREILKYGRTFEKNDFLKTVEDVQEYLELETAKGTYAFRVTYAGKSPQEAVEVANAAAKVFIDYMTNLNKSEIQIDQSLLGKQLAESKRSLAEARSDLKQFKEENETFALTEEYNEKLRIVSSLETDLEEIEVELAGLFQKYPRTHPDVRGLLAKKNRLVQSIDKRMRNFDHMAMLEKKLKELEHDVEVKEDIVESINQKYQEVVVQATKVIPEIAIVSLAEAPTYPSEPNKLKYGLYAFAISFLLGVGLAMVIDSFNMTIRNVEDVNRTLDLPVLTKVFHYKELSSS